MEEPILGDGFSGVEQELPVEFELAGEIGEKGLEEGVNPLDIARRLLQLRINTLKKGLEESDDELEREVFQDRIAGLEQLLQRDDRKEIAEFMGNKGLVALKSTLSNIRHFAKSEGEDPLPIIDEHTGQPVGLAENITILLDRDLGTAWLTVALALNRE